MARSENSLFNERVAFCQALGFDPSLVMSLTIELANDGGTYIHLTQAAPKDILERAEILTRHFELVEKADVKDENIHSP